MAVARAVLGVVILLASLGAAGAALEWAAPEPGKRYADLSPAPLTPAFPDCDHPRRACFALE